MNIGELFIALGFDVDDTKLKDFNKGLETGYKDLLKISAVSVGALYALDRFVAGSIRGAVALANFKAQTGGSIEELQKWQVVATMENVALSVETVTGSITALQGAIADVAMGKGGGPFAMLGIDVRGKDAFAVLKEMRANLDQNIKTWGLPQTIKLMQETGVDPGFINALRLTDEEFDKIAGNRFLSEEIRMKLEALGKTIANLKLDFSLFKDQLSADISPKLIELINNAVPVFKDFALSVQAVWEKLREFWDFIKPFQPVIIGFAIALVAALNPVVAVFVAFGAAVWDLGRAIRGLPSFTGGAWDQIMNLLNEDHSLDNLVARIKQWDEAAARNANPNRQNILSGPSFAIPPGLTSPQAAFNNIYNISGVSDAFTVSNEINNHQQRQLNYAKADKNNGPRY